MTLTVLNRDTNGPIEPQRTPVDGDWVTDGSSTYEYHVDNTSLDEIKSELKLTVNHLVNQKITSILWKENQRLVDEQRLELDLTMTPLQISQERQDIRTLGDLAKDEIDALTSVEEARNYKIDF